MTNHQHLRELAQNATGGDWHLASDDPHGRLIATMDPDVDGSRGYGHLVIRTGVLEVSYPANDAKFIAAANPTVVLDLLNTIDTLVTQVHNQATDIEDTRSAYQLAQRQLDACRAGQGTYGGSYSYQHGTIPPGPLTADELMQTEDD